VVHFVDSLFKLASYPMMHTKNLPVCWKMLPWILVVAAVWGPLSTIDRHASARGDAAEEPVAGAIFSGEEPSDSSYVVGDAGFARERSQHLAFLGVNRWHSWGFQGKGVKIAVLDSGFRGYQEFLGTALPAQISCKSFRNDGNLEAKDSQHGILCGEVIHALAPKAELIFANWEPDSPDQFLEAVRWACRQGARIISCSLIMPSWSDGEGGGPVNQRLAEMLGKGSALTDRLFFACAGNTADRHWSGTFHAGKDGLHEWQAHVTGNSLTPWGTETVSVELYGHLASSYELLVQETTPTGSRVIQSHAGESLNPDCQVVRFTPVLKNNYCVQVRLGKGEPGPFHLVALGGGLAYATANGSISCPADCPGVIAVGAVTKDGKRASYSSCGPNSKQLKPDLVAPVPFPSLWRPRPFSGTSAAAPQAAALAALLWSRHNEWTPDQVRSVLRQAALDLGPPGHDWETGYGQVTLPGDLLPRPASFNFLAIHP
jgi:subtilisin family serine protease